MRTCSVEGCTEKHLAKGYCNKHYLRAKHSESLHIVKKTKASTEERFWFYVIKGESEDDCWDWSGFFVGGRAKIAGTGRKPMGASRVSYEIHNGPIPEGMFVCHTCDNGRCSNPKHLFLGTNADNMADKVRKGRQARGERGGRTKFSDDVVRAIRRDSASMKTKELSEKYGVSKGHVECIVKNKNRIDILEVTNAVKDTSGNDLHLTASGSVTYVQEP